MGRGPRSGDDPPMKSPVDLLTEAEGDGGSGGNETSSYCASRRELPFEINASVRLAIGEEIELRIGDPVEVHRDGTLVGTLRSAESSSMRGCITMGYRMSGIVVSLDLVQGIGTISISGVHRENT